MAAACGRGPIPKSLFYKYYYPNPTYPIIGPLEETRAPGLLCLSRVAQGLLARQPPPQHGLHAVKAGGHHMMHEVMSSFNAWVFLRGLGFRV